MEQITKELLKSIFKQVHYIMDPNKVDNYIHFINEDVENHWKNSYNAIAYVFTDAKGNLSIQKIVCKNKRFHLNEANN